MSSIDHDEGIMYQVIKNKGKIIQAYQLGVDSRVIRRLIKDGKVMDLGDGRYEVHSQEAINGAAGGEIARAGDWIKIDSSDYPYPNDQAYFAANHRHIAGDTFEQIPRPVLAWDARLVMCREVTFLIENKGLIIDPASSHQRYTAQLWGTTEAAAEDALIVFYNISYDADGEVQDCDWNFVQREEFDRTYSIIG